METARSVPPVAPSPRVEGTGPNEEIEMSDTIMQLEAPVGASTASTNGAGPALPRAVRRLRSLSCETQQGRQRFTRQHLMRVERFRRRLTPRGRQVFGHLSLVELAVLLDVVGNYMTEPEV
jgi:hypothetical protein